MTSQTYERAPRLTKLLTAHISKGVHPQYVLFTSFTHSLLSRPFFSPSLSLPLSPFSPLSPRSPLSLYFHTIKRLITDFLCTGVDILQLITVFTFRYYIDWEVFVTSIKAEMIESTVPLTNLITGKRFASMSVYIQTWRDVPQARVRNNSFCIKYSHLILLWKCWHYFIGTKFCQL